VFTLLFIASLIAGIAISWIGWYGQLDHNNAQRRKK
jgi:hypothetical protein